MNKLPKRRRRRQIEQKMRRKEQRPRSGHEARAIPNHLRPESYPEDYETCNDRYLFDITDLQEMQAWSLERKVFHTIEVVQSFMAKMSEIRGGIEAKDCYVSFSGGVDSLVLLNICRRFIEKDFPAVFCQTGQEWSEIVKFVRRFDNVEIIRPKWNVKQIVAKYGFPLVSKEVSQYVYEARTCRAGTLRDKRLGKLGDSFAIPKKWRWLVDADFQTCHLCCHFLKKEPFRRYEKETGRLPLLGITAEESKLRTTEWLKRGGCNAFNGRVASYPMSIWTSADVWEYVRRNNIEYCEIYDKLARKQTGCVFCGFGMHLDSSRLRTLWNLHPKRYLWTLGLENNGVTYRQALSRIGVELPDEYRDLFD